MARHGGGVPGMASPKQIQKTALALARASLPTKRSVMSDYNRSIRDVGGFTDAILGQLRGAAGQIGGGYDAAIADQSSVDAAARARLTALGGEYGAGSAAAVGGMGDSAASRLIAGKAAATAYGAKLPAVAGARGQLLQSGLVQQRGEALKQRSEQLRQAYTQAYQQVQQNALATAVAGANIRNQNAQLGLQQASLAEQKRQFDATFGLQQQQFLASLQGGQTSKSGVSGMAKQLGLTPNEIHGILGDAAAILNGTAPDTARVAVYANRPDPNNPGKTIRVLVGYNQKPVGGSGSPSAVAANVPFETAVQQLIQQNIQRPLAFVAAARAYKAAPRTSLAWRSFVQFMAQHGVKKYRRYWKKTNQSSGMPPSLFGGPH